MIDDFPKTSKREVFPSFEAYLLEVVIDEDMIFVLHSLEQLWRNDVFTDNNHH